LLVPFTEDVEADLIISKQNAPTTLAHYTVVTKNILAILPATTVAGIITLATQEVNAGVDANKAVTPVTLQAKLNLSGSQTVTRNEFAIIGDAAALCD
jgi:hypothetical protein